MILKDGRIISFTSIERPINDSILEKDCMNVIIIRNNSKRMAERQMQCLKKYFFH